MIIYGASGHAKVIIDILLQNGDEEFVLIDDNPEISELIGNAVSQPQELDLRPRDKVIVAVGVNEVRQKIVAKLNTGFFSAIHTNAQINTLVTVGLGSMVAAGVTINSGTQIGDHCIINTNSSVDHDCEVANFVHIAPGVTICGRVSVGEGSLIGAGATVLPQIKIGKWATIGAGAVVTQDVPDNTTFVGVPARPLNI